MFKIKRKRLLRFSREVQISPSSKICTLLLDLLLVQVIENFLVFSQSQRKTWNVCISAQIAIPRWYREAKL